MKKYKMNWENLLSSCSSRDRGPSRRSNDLRSAFEKDYHRILSSASFRRLQDKTQVFPLEKNDFIRTRLTHSIEVSSFARSLAQSVSNEIITKNIDMNFRHDMSNHISNVLASAALLHDIGNPPFGHFGEDTIRDWFKNKLFSIEMEKNGENIKIGDILSSQMKSDLTNFEGNAQALRVASKLHFLVDEYGMNLTYALLNTLIKYPVSSENIDKNSGDLKTKKMGYNYSEEKLFFDIVKSTGTIDEETGEIYRHPLTFLLEAADDIAYCTADIEDGVKKGYITYNDLLNSLETLTNKEMKNELIFNLEKYKEKAKIHNYGNEEIYSVQRWTVYLQGQMISYAVDSFITNYEKIMNGEYKVDLFENTDSRDIVKAMKNLALTKIFNSKSIVKMEIAANNIIKFFLNNFISAFIYYDTDLENEKISSVDKKYIAIMSDNYLLVYKYYSRKYEEIEKNKDKIYQHRLYLRLLLVTDYICGMTDSYAKTLYQELTGIN